MGAAGVEIPEWVNERTVEEAFRRCFFAMENRRVAFAEKGMRAARGRDSRLLKALEAGTEVLHGIQERQYGRSLRSTSTPYGERVELTYKLCDAGIPSEHFQWVYGMAAELAGL
jgi:hypothetical protein